MIFDGAKLAIYAGAAIVIVVLAYKAYDAIGDARETKVRAEYQKQLDELNAKVEEAEKLADSISEDKDREHQAEKDELNSRIAGLLSAPSPGIRLCKPATRNAEAARVSESAAQPNDSTERDGSDLRSGPDISSAVLVFAGQCEADRQTVIAWQSWYRDQSAAWGF